MTRTQNPKPQATIKIEEMGRNPEKKKSIFEWKRGNLEKSGVVGAKELFDLRVFGEDLTTSCGMGFVCVGPEEAPGYCDPFSIFSSTHLFFSHITNLMEEQCILFIQRNENEIGKCLKIERGHNYSPTQSIWSQFVCPDITGWKFTGLPWMDLAD